MLPNVYIWEKIIGIDKAMGNWADDVAENYEHLLCGKYVTISFSP